MTFGQERENIVLFLSNRTKKQNSYSNIYTMVLKRHLALDSNSVTESDLPIGCFWMLPNDVNDTTGWIEWLMSR